MKKLLNNLLKKKKGDFISIVYVVVFLAVIGMVIFIVAHLNIELFTGLQAELNTAEYNDTEAYAVTAGFKDFSMSRVWDYAFLGLFFGCLIAIGLSAYAIRISPLFYWIYGLLSLFVLAAGVVLSNAWQSLSSDPEFTTTLANFPITNTLLGSYFPLVVTVIIIIAMVILFGKPSGDQEGGYI